MVPHFDCGELQQCSIEECSPVCLAIFWGNSSGNDLQSTHEESSPDDVDDNNSRSIHQSDFSIRKQDDFVDSLPMVDADVTVTTDAAQVDIRVFKLQQKKLWVA